MPTCIVQGKNNPKDGPSELAADSTLTQVKSDNPVWETQLSWSDTHGPKAVYSSNVADQDTFIEYFESAFPYDMVT